MASTQTQASSKSYDLCCLHAEEFLDSMEIQIENPEPRRKAIKILQCKVSPVCSDVEKTAGAAIPPQLAHCPTKIDRNTGLGSRRFVKLSISLFS